MIKYIESKQFDGQTRSERLKYNINFKKYKTLLYIGARPNRIDHLNLFENYDVTIMEIWDKNVKNLQNKLNLSQQVRKSFSKLNSLEIIKGDIISNNSLNKKFDIVMWWHGPEHVEESNLNKAIENCEEYSKNKIVLGCPWGDYLGHSMDSNPFEKHVSTLYPEFFENIGYNVEVQGKEGPGSNIMSIKTL